MTLAITLARLSRQICLVPRLHRLGYVTENALTKKAWEDAVQGLGKRRVSLLHRTVTGFWQKISVKKAFSQNEKSGWPVAPLSHWSFVVMPGRKDSPLPVRRLTRSTRKKNASISRLQARNTSQGFPVILSMRLGLSKSRLDRVAYRRLNGLRREHTSLAERLFP